MSIIGTTRNTVRRFINFDPSTMPQGAPRGLSGHTAYALFGGNLEKELFNRSQAPILNQSPNRTGLPSAVDDYLNDGTNPSAVVPAIRGMIRQSNNGVDLDPQALTDAQTAARRLKRQRRQELIGVNRGIIGWSLGTTVLTGGALGIRHIMGKRAEQYDAERETVRQNHRIPFNGQVQQKVDDLGLEKSQN